jgi:hypothetical protein
MRVFESMKTMKDGDVMGSWLRIPVLPATSSPGTKRTGNTLLANEKRGNDYVATIIKGGQQTAPAVQSAAEGQDDHRLQRRHGQSVARSLLQTAPPRWAGPSPFSSPTGADVFPESKEAAREEILIESIFGAMMPAVQQA